MTAGRIMGKDRRRASMGHLRRLEADRMEEGGKAAARALGEWTV